MSYNIMFLDTDTSKEDLNSTYDALRAAEIAYRFRFGSVAADPFIKRRLIGGKLLSIGYPALRIRGVRLKKPKSYCGQHAFSCEVANPGRAGKPRRGKWLEGADWVAFNDMVNDILDDLNIAADVWSTPLTVAGRLVIREGYNRCTVYQAEVENGGDWCEFGTYADCRYCRRPVHADYPEGTPGNPYYYKEIRCNAH